MAAARSALGLLITLLVSAAARAETTWSPAWMASPQPVWARNFVFPTNVPELKARTLREVLHLGFGGRQVRLRLSNRYGSGVLVIDHITLARSAGGERIDPLSSHDLTVGGASRIEIAPGADVLTDPVALAVKPGSDLAVSVYLRSGAPIETFHWDGRRTAYVATGDCLAAVEFPVERTTTVRLFVTEVLVDHPGARGALVVLGDSITDGAGARLDGDQRWPDRLAARVAPRGLAVVNAGISGARLLSDGMGVNALARLDDDVLAQPGVVAVVVLLGINDIAWPGTPFAPAEPPMTYGRMIQGYQALAARAHARGLRVIAGTLTPFAGALPDTPLGRGYYSGEKDELRRRVNTWIRSSRVFDQVVDFDHVLRDPAAPERLLPAYDSGDHLHPNDRGDQAMADAISLNGLAAPQR